MKLATTSRTMTSPSPVFRIIAALVFLSAGSLLAAEEETPTQPAAETPTQPAAETVPQPAAELISQLAKMPHGKAYWIEDDKADENDPRTARHLMKQLAQLGKPAVPGLIEALGHKDEAVQGRAARVLAQMGPDAVDAIPAFIEQLGLESGYTPDPWAMSALIRLGELARPALLSAIAGEDFNVRCRAIEALARIRPVSPDSAEILVKLLGDIQSTLPPKDLSLTVSAASALAQMGEPAVQPLIAALENDPEFKLSIAYKILEEIGPSARQALPLLHKRQKLEVHPTKLWRLNRALQSIEIERTAAEAMSDLKATRVEALAMLGQGYWLNGCTPAQGEAAIKSLIANLTHKETYFRNLAALGLAHTTNWANLTMPALLSVATDTREETKTRKSAIISLGTLRAGAADALPDLRKIAKGPAHELRKCAARAIERIEHPDASLGCEE